jgi:hypothetical protein
MNSYCFHEPPADEATAKLEEGLMYVRQPFESNAKPSELMQPRNRTLDHPTRFAQTTAVSSAAACKLRSDATCRQPFTQGIRVVSAIRLNQTGFAPGRAAFAANPGHRLQQRLDLRHIVPVSLGEHYRDRDAVGVREEVVLAARTTAIGWVRSTFFPAPTARMEELSAMTREKSNFSAPRSLPSNVWCSRSQTRALCHALSRRQQVIPEPHPISLGSISQGMPERSTNSIPLNTRRSHSGSRPAWRLRLRFLGNSGSICFHSPSSMSGFGMRLPQGYAMPQNTKSFKKVQVSFC